MAEAITSFAGSHRFLSNFWPSTFRFDGKLYPSSEHAFQAMKTADPGSRETIRLARSPGVAKRMGRKVTLRADWDDARIGVMRDVLYAKFADEVLAEMLLSTGDAELVEGNTWGDREWGVDLRTGEGKNMLGKLLMELREELRACSDKST